ncbi:MAG: TolC family protein [Bacteroidia bacterium]|nr:TolC family protein [Bacteroidia bacterium]
MKYRFVFIFLFLPLMLTAQEVLKLEEAVKAALENNYGIQVAENSVLVSRNNAHPGNAGLLPRVSFDAGGNYNNSNAEVELINADAGPGDPPYRTIEAKGLQTYGANAGIGVSYTVFDGLGNVYNYRVLKANVSLTEEQTRALIEQNLVQVISAYYGVARLSGTVYILQEQLSTSRNRIEYVKNQNQFGSANRLAILNAEVDINTDSANLATAKLNLQNSLRNLNLLMGRELTDFYIVDTAVVYQENLQFEELKTQAISNNASLKAAALSQQVSELSLRVNQAARYPRLAVNASYGYNYTNNGPVSFARSIQSLGFSGGASLSFNIYDGSRTNRNVQNAEIALASSLTRKKETEQQLLLSLYNAFDSWQNSLAIYELEQKSLVAAEQNFARTQEIFKLGQATSVQFRDAQLNVLRVKNRLNDLKYDIKLNESELMLLSGQLMPSAAE